jgi:N-acetylglucosamine kinase-like BadF-type ATPase
MRRLRIGVDGGKSKTVCLLADPAGAIVGWGRSGASDTSVVPMHDALDAVAAAIDAATRTAEMDREDIQIGCFGMAGVVWPEDFDEVHRLMVARGLAPEVIVKNDAQIALRAAVLDGQGMVVSAGTHLSVAIRVAGHAEWFSGWSSIDGPGGAELGRRVVWAVVHAYDGRGESTALTDAIETTTGLDAHHLLRAISRGEVDEAFTAGLAPLLFRTYADTEDPVAGAIIQEAAHGIARWIIGLSRRFDLMESDLDVYLTGGLFRCEGRLLQDSLAAEVRATVPRVRLRPAEREPVFGAIFEALSHGGVPITPDIIGRMMGTALPQELFETASWSDPPGEIARSSSWR